MFHKKTHLLLLVLAVLSGLTYWIYLYTFSVPVLNLSPLDDGHLPVLSLQWSENTLRPINSNGTIQLKTASVNLNLPNLDTSVLKPSEDFLAQWLTPETLEEILPPEHNLYGLLEFHGNYWLISGKQVDKPFLVALGNFHQLNEAKHTVVSYKAFYHRELAALRDDDMSMSSAS